MALIAETYFKGIIDLDYSKATTKEVIGYYSDYCEEKYLKKLLGTTQYLDYAGSKTAPKYVSLLTAANFTYQGETYANNIKQMLAYFIYFELVQDSQGFNTVVGEMSANVENAQRGFATKKLTRAWNEAVQLYEIAELYLESQAVNFPNYETEEMPYLNTFGI